LFTVEFVANEVRLGQMNRAEVVRDLKYDEEQVRRLDDLTGFGQSVAAF
jgi:hypothetical protein